MENLPEEITTEIFVRLPVKSIIRCKSVRKSWYVLITNPNFVSNHLAYQHQFNNNLMFLKRWHNDPDTNQQRFESMCIFSNNDVDNPEPVNLPLSIQHQLCSFTLTLIGHCDGLIALADRQEHVIVCNPATREFRTLPNSSFSPIPYNATVIHGDDGCVTRYMALNNFLGFGYDCNAKDYKIVRVVTFFSSSTAGWQKHMHRVEVFCIRTDACWRELNVMLDSGTYPLMEEHEDSYIREPYFDGVCYWWVIDYRTCPDHVLISFHLADEVFRKTPMPTLDCFEDVDTRVSIGVYNKSIALFVYPGGVDCGGIDIWVMKEFGVEESWSKLFTVKLPFTDVRHFGFWNGSDKELLYVDFSGQLAIYNCVTTESKTLLALSIKPTEARGHVRRWTTIPYMKTIVSVKSML